MSFLEMSLTGVVAAVVLITLIYNTRSRSSTYYRVYLSRHSLFKVMREGNEIWVTRRERLKTDQYLGICVPGKLYRRQQYCEPGHRRHDVFGEIPSERRALMRSNTA
jgi:hypothetical protein